MKNLTAILLAVFAALACAEEPRTLPDFLPAAPAKEKAIINYTANDVMGCMFTSNLPNNHNFCINRLYGADIKANWPGSKDANQIDIMIQIVLDAPANVEIIEYEDVQANLRYTLRKVMDVSAIAKADALIRIVNAQNDPLKQKRAKKFATSMFEELLDPRLLAYEIEFLEDSTIVLDMTREGDNELLHDKITARSVSRDTLISNIETHLDIVIDSSPFIIDDEGAGCLIFKAWLATNWNIISAKCADKQAIPDRELPVLISSKWDARD